MFEKYISVLYEFPLVNGGQRYSRGIDNFCQHKNILLIGILFQYLIRFTIYPRQVIGYMMLRYICGV